MLGYVSIGCLLFASVSAYVAPCNRNYDLSNPCAFDPLIVRYQKDAPLEIKKDNCDQEYDKTNFKNAPLVYYDKAEDNELYTLAMIDPDAPKHREAGKAWLHWLIPNIPSDKLKSGELPSEQLLSYHPPGPPKDTGVHDYQFFLFTQNKAQVNATAPSERPLFDLKTFATDNNLCNLVASVGFKAAFTFEQMSADQPAASEEPTTAAPSSPTSTAAPSSTEAPTTAASSTPASSAEPPKEPAADQPSADTTAAPTSTSTSTAAPSSPTTSEAPSTSSAAPQADAAAQPLADEPAREDAPAAASTPEAPSSTTTSTTAAPPTTATSTQPPPQDQPQAAEPASPAETLPAEVRPSSTPAATSEASTTPAATTASTAAPTTPAAPAAAESQA